MPQHDLAAPTTSLAVLAPEPSRRPRSWYSAAPVAEPAQRPARIAERVELESLSRRASAPFRLMLRSRIVLLAAAGTANRRSRSGWASARTRPASGGAGTAGRASRDWPTHHAPAGRACSRPRRGPGQGPRVRDARREPSAPGPMDLPELARHAAASGIAPTPSTSTVRRLNPVHQMARSPGARRGEPCPGGACCNWCYLPSRRWLAGRDACVARVGGLNEQAACRRDWWRLDKDRHCGPPVEAAGG
jgi:hypothetical protein